MADKPKEKIPKSSLQTVQVYGRKKTATAVALCRRGKGILKVNGKPLNMVEPRVLKYKLLYCCCPVTWTRNVLRSSGSKSMVVDKYHKFMPSYKPSLISLRNYTKLLSTIRMISDVIHASLLLIYVTMIKSAQMKRDAGRQRLD